MRPFIRFESGRAELRLIVPIGEWVLRESLRQMREWNHGVDVHVNLSPKQLLQPNVVEVVSAALRESGVPARRLHLEVTESLLIDNAAATRSSAPSRPWPARWGWK